MKVREIIEGVGGKKITLPDAAEQLNTTTRTLRSKLALLGMQWNQATRLYEYVGNPERKDIIMDFDIAAAIKERGNKSIKEATGGWVRPAPHTDSVLQQLQQPGTIEKVKQHAAANKPVKAEDWGIEFDSMPIKPRRFTRSFYIEEDIEAVLNQARHKSDFINQALRIVFEGMELL